VRHTVGYEWESAGDMGGEMETARIERAVER
jgi:hypothetical protein